MTNQQERKKAIRAFLHTAGDVQLAALLAECRDGKFSYMLACHCLRGIVGGGTFEGYQATHSAVALAAESAICVIGVNAAKRSHSDAPRIRILIPMLRAEFRRREKLRQAREVASPEISSVDSNPRATARVAQ